MSPSSIAKYSSIWHYFNVDEKSTYPQQEAAVQIQRADGRLEEGSAGELFSTKPLQTEPRIVGWRYVRRKGNQ